MFRTLRNRLILSHILPVLLVIPLMGLALLNMLENRFLLPVVYAGLEEDATLLAEIVRDQPELWESPLLAQQLAASAGPFLSGRATFILPDGELLASSSPEDPALLGEKVDLPDAQLFQSGQVVKLQNGPSAAVFVPISTEDGDFLGIVELSTQVATITDQIYQVRYIIAAVLLIGIAVGIVVAWGLALQIGRPVQQATEAIVDLAQGDYRIQVPVEGPQEIRDLTGAVNSLTSRLDNLEKSRRQLLANLVHELGRPLGALRSAVQALRHGASRDPELADELLAGMETETLLLERLLDDLAKLYDQVLGPLELNRGWLALSEWLGSELLPWQADAMAKGLNWQALIPEDLPKIFADSDRLAQAIGNLLSNAIKFTPAGGEIEVRAEVRSGEVWIDVIDSGPGIPEDEMEMVFAPFFRGGHGKRIIQGMGLGLTIARDICKAHGGRIVLENRPGGGCRFGLVLPIRPI